MSDADVPKSGGAPGARERHLRRRAGNVLFAAGRREVSRSEIDLARAADEREARQFRDDFLTLVNEAMELPPRAESEVLLALKGRLADLFDVGAGLGGEHAQELLALDRLHNTITEVIRANAAGDALAQSELDQEAQARALHRELIRYPLVADLLRADSPIEPDELVPTLLSEDTDAVRAAMALFDPPQRRELHRAARAVLDELERRGGVPDGCRPRLAILEAAAGRGGEMNKGKD